MKKILFSLVALVCSMSINAQIMKVMKGNTVVATYTAEQADNVVFVKVPTTGTAYRKPFSSAGWVQLWENGPKFAEFNVGADSPTEYGGYYYWGGSINIEGHINTTYKEGTNPLTDTDDTASCLWGDNWRMPTRAELQGLLDNCDIVWTDNYNGSGVKGRIFTGKDDYATNSIFLPAAGDNLSPEYKNVEGRYWASTPSVYSTNREEQATYLFFVSDRQEVSADWRFHGYSVRAVLAK